MWLRPPRPFDSDPVPDGSLLLVLALDVRHARVLLLRPPSRVRWRSILDDQHVLLMEPAP
jgi:hypothetical protein